MSILLARYRKIRKLKQKPLFFNKTSPYSVGLFLIGLSIGYLGVSISEVAADLGYYSTLVLKLPLIVSVVVLLFLAALLSRWYQNTIDVVNFEKYRAKVLNQITKLGGDTEAIFQIDREIQLPK